MTHSLYHRDIVVKPLQISKSKTYKPVQPEMRLFSVLLVFLFFSTQYVDSCKCRPTEGRQFTSSSHLVFDVPTLKGTEDDTNLTLLIWMTRCHLHLRTFPKAHVNTTTFCIVCGLNHEINSIPRFHGLLPLCKWKF